MNAIFLAVLLTAAGPTFEVQTIDGKTAVGRLTEFSADRLMMETQDGRKSLLIEKVLTISAKDKHYAAQSEPRLVVELTDGSTIHGRQFVVQGSMAKISLADGETLEAPVNIVRTVQFQQPPESLGAEWMRLTGMKADGDLLVVCKDKTLDYHRGILHDVTADDVRFDLDGEVLAIKRSKTLGLIYRREAEGELPAATCRITDAAGSQWSAHSLSLSKTPPSPSGRWAGGEGGKSLPLNPPPTGKTMLRWTTPAGLSIARSAEQIVQIDFSGGKIVYLSDLKPTSVRWTPFFGVGKQLAEIERFHAPRGDRNFDGGPLLLGGKTYRKGLALHSRTEIAYRLDQQYSRLQATAGIDDSVRPAGNVRLIVRGDGKELLNTAVSGSDSPQAVDLDLTGVRRLAIVVDFGQSLSSGDYLLLGDARLSK